MSHRFLPRAIADLEAIASVIAADNPRATDKWIDTIENKCRLLSDHPEMDLARDDIRAGLRFVPVGNYLIFYRLKERHVDIVRVLHGARNLKNILVSFKKPNKKAPGPPPFGPGALPQRSRCFPGLPARTKL